jgi:hypothetical protein
MEAGFLDDDAQARSEGCNDGEECASQIHRDDGIGTKALEESAKFSDRDNESELANQTARAYLEVESADRLVERELERRLGLVSHKDDVVAM